MSENFDNEVVRGNKDRSDHSNDKNERGVNMVFTKYDDPIDFDNEVMEYLAFGNEVCPTTGRKHYQGFVCWKSARWTFACRKKYKCYFKKMRGSLIQNEDYCSKESQLIEYGQIPKQGHRSDLDKLKDRIVNGTSVDEITMENPMIYHQYGRTLEKIEDIVNREKHRTEMTTCDWIYGESGIGKSHTAFSEYSNKTHYVYPDDNGWWDGYKGQHTIIFNEFRGQIKYCELLALIDKWPISVKRRGREPIPFTSKHIIITSSLHPQDVYYNINLKDDLKQLLRRINLIHKTKKETIIERTWKEYDDYFIDCENAD